ncbi:MAG: hypothetical protein RL033_2734 [Pseudomonadota bacterium]|jgi:hypothetical protein
MKLAISLTTATCCLLAAAPALAKAPSGFVTGFERIESISYVQAKTTLAGVEQTSSSWRAGMGTNAGNGYSIPRISLEYSWELGLSVGVAIGFTFSWKDKVAPDAEVFEPRVGYSVELTDDLLLWPRLGLTIHDLTNPDATHTALSVTLPVLSRQHDLGSMNFGPYVDVGLGGSAGDADQKLTEFGIAIGFQLF